MPMTLRLKPDIETRAKAYAETVGVSLNALVALALDHYLAAQKRQASAWARRLDGPASDTPRAARRLPAGPASLKLGRNDLCHCGSGVKFKRCHGAASA